MGTTTSPLERREPPPFRRVVVTERTELSSRMLRLGVAGDDLGQMDMPEPTGSVRLLVPGPGTDELVVPEWTGNEFLLPDGNRPIIRTFTPLRFDATAGTLDLEIVRHPGGAVSQWAETATPGSAAAISGPARGIEIDPAVERWILVADETALPALGQLIAALPADATVVAHAEVVSDDARIDLPHHPRAEVNWHVNTGGSPGRKLVEAVQAGVRPDDGDHVWAAGEAASMQAIRKYLFDEVGLTRSSATVRGYWKPDRSDR